MIEDVVQVVQLAAHPVAGVEWPGLAIGGVKIAAEAAKSARIGARALKGVYARIIKPFEFDPFSREEVRPKNGRYEFVIDEDLVRRSLRTILTIPA